MHMHRRHKVKHSFIKPSLPFLIIVFFLVVSSTKTVFAQQRFGRISNLDSIVFRDNVNGWRADSMTHNLGIMPPVNIALFKYFKYVGDDTVTITGAWTGDPHYICEYPRDTLVKGKIYSFNVCFYFQGGLGYFNKMMGFNLSNGQKIAYEFEGYIKK